MLRDYVQDKLNFSKVASEIFRALRTNFDIVLVQPCCSDRVLPGENAVTLHFYDPFIKMSLSQTSFTGCNQPPRSVLLTQCWRRCCCLCRNCYWSWSLLYLPIVVLYMQCESFAHSVQCLNINFSYTVPFAFEKTAVFLMIIWTQVLLLNECLYSDAVPYNAPYCNNIKSRNQQKIEG